MCACVFLWGHLPNQEDGHFVVDKHSFLKCFGSSGIHLNHLISLALLTEWIIRSAFIKKDFNSNYIFALVARQL